MRGLLAVECLYHQIVAGNKTQTRRSGGLELVNGRKATKKKPAIITNPDEWELVRFNHAHAKFWKKNDALQEVYCKPRYKIGEVMYLKEPYIGKAGNYSYVFNLKPNSELRKGNGSTVIWKNKLFMPASAARAFIRITGIRCERLLDISDRDCTAEGIELYPLPGQATLTYTDYLCKGLQNHVVTPKESFLSLYKFANKVKEVPNLWVWVYEIEYLKNYQP